MALRSTCLAQDRVLTASVQEAATFVEPGRLPRQYCCQIETETVDVHLLRPIAQRVRNELQHALMTEIDRISRSGVVDVVARSGASR